MSVEIYGSNPEIKRLSSEVGSQVAEILKSNGVAPDIAHSIGEQAAGYGAELVFVGCEESGVEGLDVEDLLPAVEVLGDIAVHPENIPFYEADLERRMDEGA